MICVRHSLFCLDGKFHPSPPIGAVLVGNKVYLSLMTDEEEVGELSEGVS